MFFRDWRSHYTVGYAYGLTLLVLPKTKVEQKIVKLDIWGWNREVAQHDDTLTEHQQQEAAAWGAGARKATGLINLSYPHPPYPNDCAYIFSWGSP